MDKNITQVNSFLSSARVLLKVLVVMLVSSSIVEAEKPSSTQPSAATLRGYINYDEQSDIHARRAFGYRNLWRDDENVYVYPARYVEQYRGMPERWIDDGLTGAYAVAWRYEEDDVYQCGYGGDAKNCKRVSNCKIELYFEDDKAPKWNYSSLREIDLGRERSNRFLIPQSKEDKAAQKKLISQVHDVLGEIRYQYTTKNGSKQQSLGYVSSYNRESDLNISNATLDVSCAVALQADVSQPIKITLFADQATAHEINLPPSYVKRIQAYQQTKPVEVKAIDDGEPLVGDYETWFTEQGWQARGRQGYFLLDPNIWSYQAGFARRFGMPQRWVEPTMQDTQAMAFRISRDYTKSCGYGGDGKACTYYASKRWDVYVSMDRPVGWNPHYRSYRGPARSEPVRHQSGRVEQEYVRAIKNGVTRFNLRHIGGLSFIYKREYWFKPDKITSSALWLRYYRRNLYSKTNVSPELGMFCFTPVSLNYNHVSKDVSIGVSKDMINWTYAKHKLYRMKVPEPFWDRVYQYVELHGNKLDGVWNIVKRQLNLSD